MFPKRTSYAGYCLVCVFILLFLHTYRQRKEKDINMCDADLHSCSRYAKCSQPAHGQFSCACLPGYVGDGFDCLPQYDTPIPEELSWDYEAAKFNIVNVTDMKIKSGGNMVYFQDVDSAGGDYRVADKFKGKPDELQRVCREDSLCIGINTDGYMKKDLKSRTKWSHAPGRSIYVFDLDFCSISHDRCPETGECVRAAAGDYRCECPTDRIKSGKDCLKLPPIKEDLLPEKEEEKVQGEGGKVVEAKKENADTNQKSAGVDEVHKKLPGPVTHVIWSLDEGSLPGLPASLNSVLSSSSGGISAHVVVCGALTTDNVQQYLKLFSLDTVKLQLHVVNLDVTMIDPVYIEHMKLDSPAGHMNSCANYARFFLHRLFPAVHVALYLDVDILVRKDVAEFITEANALNSKVIAAVNRDDEKLSSLFPKEAATLYEEYKKQAMKLEQNSYSAGLFVANLTLWRQRQEEIERDLKHWMRVNLEKKLFTIGTQSLMLMTFYDKMQTLSANPRYTEEYGMLPNIPQDKIDTGLILHWSGKHKPWNADGLHKDLWRTFLPAECSRHGHAVKGEAGQWTCVCDSGHAGDTCQQQT